MKKKTIKAIHENGLENYQQRSKEYKTAKKPYQTDVQISDELLTEGIQYGKVFIHVQDTTNGPSEFYMFNSKVHEYITEEHVREFRSTVYQTFDEFKQKAFIMW